MRAIGEAELRLGHAVFRRAIDDEIAPAIVLGLRRACRAEMQNADMRGVEIALDRLEPIAMPLHEADVLALARLEAGLEQRQARRLGRIAHIDPDHAVALRRQIGLGADPVLELLALGQIGLIDAIAVDIVFPAVIDAAYAVLLVAPQEQRGAAMRAAMIHHPDPAGCIAERDQLLAEEKDPHRRPVGFELSGMRRRDPILPHQLAHRRPRAGAHQGFIGIGHALLRFGLPCQGRNFSVTSWLSGTVLSMTPTSIKACCTAASFLRSKCPSLKKVGISAS